MFELYAQVQSVMTLENEKEFSSSVESSILTFLECMSLAAWYWPRTITILDPRI